MREGSWKGRRHGLRWPERRRWPQDGHPVRRTGVEESLDASCPVPLVDVADLQLDPPAGRPEPVASDRDEGALPDHVTPEPDPVMTLQLEPDACRLGERPAKRGGQAERLQNEEACPCQPCTCGKTPQQAFPPRRQAPRQVHDEQLDRPATEQCSREAESLDRISGAQDEEPGEIHTACDRLERIERATEIQPGGDRAAPLCLGDAAQRKRGLSARLAPAQRDAGVTDQAARSEDGIQCRKAGRDDTWIGRRERIRFGRACRLQHGNPGTARGLDHVGMWRHLLRCEDGRKRAGIWNRLPDADHPTGIDRPAGAGRPSGIDRTAISEADHGVAPAILEMGEGGGEGFDWSVHRPTYDRTNVLFVNRNGRHSASGDVARITAGTAPTCGAARG